MPSDLNSLCNTGNRKNGVSEAGGCFLFEARLIGKPRNKNKIMLLLLNIRSAGLSSTCYLKLLLVETIFALFNVPIFRFKSNVSYVE